MTDINTSQLYELFSFMTNTKRIKIPVTENDDNNYKTKTFSLSTFNNNRIEEKIEIKIKDYEYTTESISKIFEIAKILEIEDFSLELLENLSYECIANIYLKLKYKYIEENSLHLFFVSELFIKILITFASREEIYQEGVCKNKFIFNTSDDIYSLSKIINIEKNSVEIAEKLLNKFMDNDEINISDIFWSVNKLVKQRKFIYLFTESEAKNDFFNSLFIENHNLNDDALQFLKEYSKYNNDNYIIETCSNVSSLKEINLQDIPIEILINNIFIKKNIIIPHFNFSVLLKSNKNDFVIILYLINKIGLSKVKELYINNITIKNDSLKHIIDLLILKNNKRIKQKYNLNKKIYMDEKNGKIYYKK